MKDEVIIEKIKQILIEAAKNEDLVGYKTIYNLFNADKNHVWNTFEKACREICDPSEALYSALMAKKDTGLPNDGFFNQFRGRRSDKFKQITGSYSATPVHLTLDQRIEIAGFEREKVFKHASEFYN